MRSVAFTPDGRRAAIASATGVGLYELPFCRRLARLPALGTVLQVALDDAGRRLFVLDGRGILHLYRLHGAD